MNIQDFTVLFAAAFVLKSVSFATLTLSFVGNIISKTFHKTTLL